MTTLYVDNIAPNLQSKISAPNLQLPSGSVLNTYYVDNDDVQTTASSSYADITGLSITLTPTTVDSKFLIYVSLNVGWTDADPYAQFKLFRNSTEIGSSTNASATGNRSGVFLAYANPTGDGVSDPYAQYKSNQISRSFLDDPDTTDSLTYKIQWRQPWVGTAYLNRASNNNDDVYVTYHVSCIHIQEIAG